MCDGDFTKPTPSPRQPDRAILKRALHRGRQRQSSDFDAFLAQRQGFDGRGLTADRSLPDFAVVHAACLLGKVWPDVIGVLDHMLHGLDPRRLQVVLINLGRAGGLAVGGHARAAADQAARFMAG